jgi:hypothetical protein
VAHSGFHFALAIRIVHPTWQSDGPVVHQYIAIVRIQNGIVEIGFLNSFAQVIQNNNPGYSA